MKWVQRLIILLCILFLAAHVPVRTDYGYFCDYTGSSKEWTTWFWLFESDYKYQKSKLEEFLESNHTSELEHKWVSFRGTTTYLFTANVLAHGSPNGLFYFEPSLFAKWCNASTDQEKKQFYDFLRTASREEVGAKVRPMIDQMMK
jgi:hypothetical protein